MFNPSDDTAPTLNELERLANQIKFILDARGCAKRIDELAGMTTQAIEAKAGAERAQVALSARVAELDKREAKIREDEADAFAHQAQVNERQARLHDIARDIREEGNAFKVQILNYAGLAEHFNSRLQSLPDWDALALMVLGQPDPHMSGDHHATRGEVSDEVEPVPHAVIGTSLTRSRQSVSERRAMRRVDH